MKQLNLDSFTTKVAIGSLWVFSAFLFACGFYNVYPFIESIATSTTWEVVAAVPVIALSYALGVIVLYLSSWAFSPRHVDSLVSETTDFVRLCGLESEFLIGRYERLRQDIEFLRAWLPTIVFLVLSVCWSSVRILLRYGASGEGIVAIGAAMLLLLVVPLILRVLKNMKLELSILVEQALSQPGARACSASTA
jgi:hypothetical protein